MALKCPSCGVVLEVRLTAAPPMQADTVKRESGSGDLKSLLDSINDEALSGMEAKFVEETRARFEKYGPTTRMSEKQLAWLKKIAETSGSANEAW